jgi:molybdopterin synthase catalytic subunit
MVRDIPGGLAKIKIEHYPGMTEKAINKICSEACLRWKLEDIMVIHRFGNLKKGELIMMIATAADHRTNAFEAAEFLMDYLKSRAPFWKKEIGFEQANWVNSKDVDEKALNRWKTP